MKKIVVGSAVFIILSLFPAWSAVTTYPDSLKVGVTFYDFHSDRSCPEFETMPTSPGNAAVTNMVDSTLDNEKKPKLGRNPFFNLYIAKWFRPWVKGDSTIPNYGTLPAGDYPAASAAGVAPTPIKTSTDTAFKDSVIKDSLVLRLVRGSQGTYTFNNPTYFPLDNRGFGAEGRAHNFSYTMELHYRFTMKPGLTFQFTGDDDVWAFINNKLCMDLGGRHGPVTGTVNVDNLGLKNDSIYAFDFFYCERHTTGADIQITTNIISADIRKILTNFYPDSVIPAGDSVILTNKITDDTGGVRSEYNQYISYQLIPGKSGSKNTLKTLTGGTNTFYGITAYETDTIISKIVDPNNPLRILIDTVLIRVKPGPPYRVVIEADTLIADSNKTNPIPFITLDSATNFDTVYAIVYDKYDNFYSFARNAVWSSLNTGLVTVNGITNQLYAGNLQRQTRNMGIDTIIAGQTGLIPDSLNVILQTGNIIGIRLVSFTGDTVYSFSNIISMNTDQQKNTKIQVIWSNAPGVWVDGTGSWTLVPPNAIIWDAPQPPGSLAQSWLLNPHTPGQTNLIIAAGSKSDTVPVAITVADPSEVILTILTPPNKRIAGDTILVEERIKNTDGLVPGKWCGQVAYQDIFDNNKKPKWVPTISIPGDLAAAILNFGSIGNMCFRNGIDTIKVVLYDAPYTQDTLHQISTVLVSGPNGLRASTNPFVLLPGPLDSISIEDANFVSIPGPVVLNYPGGMQFFYSNGYDHYQNLIGHVNTDWTQTNTLHPIPPPKDSIFRIYYEAVDANENGYIITSVQSVLHPSVTLSDSVVVFNNGSQALLDSAVTKDLNGNGYLDRVVLYFNKPVPLTLTGAGAYALSNISLRYATKTFVIESMKSENADSTKFTLYLKDSLGLINGLTIDSLPPQSAWHPLLTMNNLPGGVRVANVKCKDGAGPVIWKVIVDRKVADDRTKDVVTIIFSEAYKAGKTGGDFKLNTAPPCSVFNVWSKTTTASFVKVDNVLSGLTFSGMPDSLTLTFSMTNNKEIFDYYYFNIISDNINSVISDKAYSGLSNIPVQINQKVIAQIIGMPGKLIVGPNPLVPTVTNGGPDGAINFKYTPEAVNWVRTNGGTVFRVLISPGSGTVTGYLRVYDNVGNLVNYGESGANMLAEVKNANPYGTTAFYSYDIYWNGTNSHGMKTAPGGYLGVLYLTTTKNGSSSTTRQVQKIGVCRLDISQTLSNH